MNVGFITGIWQHQSPTFSPEMRWGRGSPGGPGLQPQGGGVGQSPFPPLQLSQGPCFLCLVRPPLRTAGWSHVAPLPTPLPPTPPCRREWPGLWPLPPRASLDGGWVGVGKGQFLAASPILGVTKSHCCPCRVG